MDKIEEKEEEVEFSENDERRSEQSVQSNED